MIGLFKGRKLDVEKGEKRSIKVNEIEKNMMEENEIKKEEEKIGRKNGRKILIVEFKLIEKIEKKIEKILNEKEMRIGWRRNERDERKKIDDKDIDKEIWRVDENKRMKKGKFEDWIVDKREKKRIIDFGRIVKKWIELGECGRRSLKKKCKEMIRILKRRGWKKIVEMILRVKRLKEKIEELKYIEIRIWKKCKIMKISNLNDKIKWWKENKRKFKKKEKL